MPPRPRRVRPARMSVWVHRFTNALSEAGDDLRQVRRLFAFTTPYRALLFLSWVATAGYAATSAGLVHMVQPIFDDVLIRNLNLVPVSITIIVLYVTKGVCSYLSTTLVASAVSRRNAS